LEDEGFVYLTVNHTIQLKIPETGAHTNNFDGMSRQGFAFPIIVAKNSFMVDI